MTSEKTYLALAVASLFATAACGSSSPTGTQTQAQTVKCVGVNSCKGTSECQSSDGKSACQGKNECKGQGWITVPSAKDCSDKGGYVYGTKPSATPDAGSVDSARNDATAQAKIKCDGINACKGQGACTGAANACQGQNDCQGKGWLEVPSEADCLGKGGTLHKG